MDNTMFNEKDAAAMLGLSHWTLRAHRRQGKGMAYYRMGKRTMYHIDDIKAYMKGVRVEPKNP